MADEEVVLDVLIQLKEEGLEMATLVSNQLSDLNDEVKDLNQSLERNADRAHEDALALLELAGAATVARGATSGGGVLGFVSSLAALMPGGTAMGYAILGVVGLAAVLAPLAYAFLALTANAVAWTAIATVAISAIGGLAGAIFMLGAANAGGLSPATEMIKLHTQLATAIKNHQKALDELAAAQSGVDVYGLGRGSRAENVRLAQAYLTSTNQVLADTQHDIREPASGLGGPIANLGSSIDDMVHHFEAASRPMADMIATWALGFLPAIQNAGDAIEKWFGVRAPAIFATLTVIVKNLSGFFADVFSTIGRVVDYVLAHRTEFEGFWRTFLGLASGAFSGFMNVMMGIADWFRSHWPAISKAAGDAWAGMKQGWDAVAPVLSHYVQQLGRDFKDVVDHLGDLKPLLPIIGGLFGAMAVIALQLADAVLGIVRGIEALIAGIVWLVDHAGAINNIRVPHLGPGGVTWESVPQLIPVPNSAVAPSTPGASNTDRGAGPRFGSGLTVLPMVFSPIPPNQQQIVFMRDAIRRLDKGQS